MARFTSHGEVCYESSSNGRLVHPFWGDFKLWWPGEPRPADDRGEREMEKMGSIITLDDLFHGVKETPSDFHEHVETLLELASQVDVAVELSAWNKPALVAMAAGKPKVLRSVCAAPKEAFSFLPPLLKDKTDFAVVRQSSLEAEPFAHDLLFVDTAHTAARVRAELERWGPHCRRWIVLHCTSTFGERGDDGSAGILYGIDGFLDAHPEWFVKSHATNNHGLTVLSRDPAEKPEKRIRLGSFGPGTELKKLIASLGINPSPSCDCNAKARQMDEWGVEGCRERRDQIAKDLSDNAPRWKWSDRVKAAALAVTSGLAFKLSVTDPFGSLVDLAIANAEKAEGK